MTPFAAACEFLEPEEPTVQVDDAYLDRMAFESRDREVTPPPAAARRPAPPLPLEGDVKAFAERIHYALVFLLAFEPESAEAVIAYARNHMPRGDR